MDLTKLPARAQRALEHAMRNDPNPVAGVSLTPPPAGMPLTGLVPSDDDVRDYSFIPSGRMPLYEIDFRAECSPIRNQGQVGSCTAFHLDGHCGLYARRGGATTTDKMQFSTRANYAMSRQLLGFTGDSGATLRESIHAAYKFGIPYESEYPYGTNWQAIINTTTLPDAVMAAAAKNKIDSYYRIDLDNAYLHDPSILNRRIDRALADGYPVGIGIFAHRWFYDIKGPLSTHAAVRNNPPAGVTNWGSLIGGHAMVIVGRSDSLGGYIVRNSWGTEWGDNGYYLMPFGDTAEAFEFWAVAGFDGSDAPAGKYDMDSTEAKVARLYRAALGRYPDADGLKYQTTAADTIGELAVANHFMQSPEYLAKYGAAQTDEAFVTALYANVLHRAPDAAGFQYQLNALRTIGRAQLLINFSESPENRALP